MCELRRCVSVLIAWMCEFALCAMSVFIPSSYWPGEIAFVRKQNNEITEFENTLVCCALY